MVPVSSMKDIFVFLGPTLTREEAHTVLPDAHYLNPIRCGDILRILRFKPKIIGIIDGYFESTAAVWHKEILYALEEGVCVIGGASMGALRASELYKFGMELVGEIAAGYAYKTFIDDDEVAVLHDPRNFLPTTDAMVNIRATLVKAEKLKIINQKLLKIICDFVKKTSYQKRNFLEMINRLILVHSEEKMLTNLRDWVLKECLIDVKKEDALLVLEAISKRVDTWSPDPLTTVKVNKSIFFRTLYKNIMCRPFITEYSWLPIQEKVAMAARLLNKNYYLLRRLSYLLSVCYELAIQQNDIAFITDVQPILGKSWFSIYDHDFLKTSEIQYDCSGLEKNNFLQRMTIIQALVDQEEVDGNSVQNVEYYVLLLMKLSGEYIVYKKISSDETIILKQLCEKEPMRFHLLSCFAVCWRFLEKHFLTLGLEPTPIIIEEYINNFRITKNLYTKDCVENWMIQNKLDMTAFQYLHEASARLSIIVIQNNTDILGRLDNINKIWWFLDSLYLSGFYLEAKNLLSNPIQRQQEKQNILEHGKHNVEKYTLTLDFIEGEQDFFGFLDNVTSEF